MSAEPTQYIFTLDLELPEEQDYPDQHAEMKTEALRKGLIDFIEKVSDKETTSVEECDAVLFEIAMNLLEAFQVRTNSALLAERLRARHHPTTN